MRHAVAWMERHQVLCYFIAIVGAIGFGILAPRGASSLAFAIEPAIAALLFVTFLGVPFAKLAGALRDWRFLLTVLVLNFVLVPLVVWALSPILAAHEAVLIGALLALLTPCIDYVIVFTGIAGGARERLLAATPLLMLMQLVLLPVYLVLIAGPSLAQVLDPAPLVHAFVWLIVLPLCGAILIQMLAARSAPVAVCATGAMSLMVPLMMLVLWCVASSQLATLLGSVGEHGEASAVVFPLLRAAWVYVLFGAIMVALGIVAARLARLDQAAGRALVFSGMTRNSLVVLPLALALPAGFGLAPLAVVTQTLVELVLLVVCVRVVPALVGQRGRARGSEAVQPA